MSKTSTDPLLIWLWQADSSVATNLPSTKLGLISGACWTELPGAILPHGCDSFHRE